MILISKSLAKWAYAWNYIFDRTPYLHYRDYNRFISKEAYPQNISLCQLFWRTFAVTPALILTGLFVGTMVLIGIRDAILPISIVAGIIAGAGGIGWLVTKIVPAGTVEYVADGLRAAASYVDPVFGAIGKVTKTMCPIFLVRS